MLRWTIETLLLTHTALAWRLNSAISRVKVSCWGHLTKGKFGFPAFPL